MKRLNLFLLLIIVCFITCAVLSCNEKESQKLDVDKTVLEFTAGSSTCEFTITTTSDWIIEADGLEYAFGPNMGTADWYTVAPISGNGNTKVTVTSKEDTKGNSTTLRIKYDGKVKTVNLIQADVQGGE